MSAKPVCCLVGRSEVGYCLGGLLEGKRRLQLLHNFVLGHCTLPERRSSAAEGLLLLDYSVMPTRAQCPICQKGVESQHTRSDRVQGSEVISGQPSSGIRVHAPGPPVRGFLGCTRLLCTSSLSCTGIMDRMMQYYKDGNLGTGCCMHTCMHCNAQLVQAYSQFPTLHVPQARLR